MQDRVVREAVIIQNWIEDQSSRNLETVTHLTSYVQSLQKSIGEFVEGLSQGLEEYLQDQKETEFPELQRLYSYLGRMIRQLISISKGMRSSLDKHVLTQLKSFGDHLQQKNIKTYENLCNHSKEIIVAYKNMDNKPDIEDIYNPIFKQRDILNKSREKYKQTLKDFQSVNSDYLQFTKDHLKSTIRIINEILNLDGVQKYLSSTQLKKPFIVDSIIPQLTSEIQDQLGVSQLLVTSNSTLSKPNQVESRIQQFITYLLSSDVGQFRNYEQTRSLILGNQKHSIYFMQQLNEALKSDVVLSLDKYHDIQSMIKFIFASIMETQDSKEDLLINILRVACKVQSSNKWLLKQFKNYQNFWKNSSLWKLLYLHVRKSKQTKNSLKNYIRKIKRLSTITNRWMKKFSIQKSTNEQDISLEIIRQISIYMAGLEIDTEFVIQNLINLCKSQDIARLEIQKLIKYQQSSKKEILNQTYLKPIRIKQERQKWWSAKQEKKTTIIVGMSLKYLQLGEEVLGLRLVSKEWNSELINNIYRRYLEQQEKPDILSKYRLKMYLLVSKAKNFSIQQFKSLASIVPKDFIYRQIINLDVRRSMQWNLSLQSTLSQILLTFAYNYPDTGYLQGMNYLAQHLLKLTQNPNQVYKIFEYTMRNHYLHYYTNNFALLRLRIYQFIRLIQIYLPDLARHFEKQKIEGEYFLLPWAITLWGEFKGELSFVMSDGFIIDGWIWWMKVCLWVLKQKKKEYIEKRFQSLMKSFSQLINDPLFKQPLPARKIRQEIISFDVTEELLAKIQNQYICSNQQIAQMLDQRSPSVVSPSKTRKISHSLQP